MIQYALYDDFTMPVLAIDDDTPLIREDYEIDTEEPIQEYLVKTGGIIKRPPPPPVVISDSEKDDNAPEVEVLKSINPVYVLVGVVAVIIIYNILK